jgi:hypothetical protein
MASFKQHADGSVSVYNDAEQKSVWRAGGPTSPAAGGGDQTYRAPYTIKIPLNTSGQGSAALASWQNTTGDDLIIKQTVIDITTAQTATLTISVGTSASADTLPVDLIDNFAAAGVAAGCIDNIIDKGSGGKSRIKLAANKYVNVGTTAGGSCTSFRGNLYLDVIKA